MRTPLAAKQCWEFLRARESSQGTPIVDYLIETSPYASELTEKDIEDIRKKERRQDSEEDLNNRVRKLKISIANKNKPPWNLGKKHRAGMSNCLERLNWQPQDDNICFFLCVSTPMVAVTVSRPLQAPSGAICIEGAVGSCLYPGSLHACIHACMIL